MAAMSDSDREACDLRRLEWRYFGEIEPLLMPRQVLEALHAHAQDIVTLTEAEKNALIRRKTAAIKALFWAAVDTKATPQRMIRRLLADPDAAACFVLFMLEIQSQLERWSPAATGAAPPEYAAAGVLARSSMPAAVYFDLMRVSGIR